MPQIQPILVVDDDADCRAGLRELLEGHGLSVVEASDGQSALDLLLSEQQPEPSLILLDLEMPRLSGWELTTILRSYYRLSSIPVVVLSGRACPDERRHQSVAAYLLKPCNSTDLVRLVMRFAGYADELPG